jgi:hypothetical protein
MFCNDCKKRSTCKEICKELNNYLEREQSKDGYSSRHMRRKEIPHSPEMLEKAELSQIKRIFGSRTPKRG